MDLYSSRKADAVLINGCQIEFTFLNKSTPSALAFFIYPGDGNGKQRDIA